MTSPPYVVVRQYYMHGLLDKLVDRGGIGTSYKYAYFHCTKAMCSIIIIAVTSAVRFFSRA